MLLYFAGERVAQHELFSELDTIGSVSALSRVGGHLTPISEILEIVLPDDLPF